MADNYLERQYAAYEQRKADLNNPHKKGAGKKSKKNFYTRPVVTKTHEEQQAEIAALQQREQQHEQTPHEQ